MEMEMLLACALSGRSWRLLNFRGTLTPESSYWRSQRVRFRKVVVLSPHLRRRRRLDSQRANRSFAHYPRTMYCPPHIWEEVIRMNIEDLVALLSIKENDQIWFNKFSKQNNHCQLSSSKSTVFGHITHNFLGFFTWPACPPPHPLQLAKGFSHPLLGIQSAGAGLPKSLSPSSPRESAKYMYVDNIVVY